MKGEECSREERRLTLLAALALPLRACRDDSNPKPKQRLSAPSHIILNALKWKRKDEEYVTALHAMAPQLLQSYHQLQVSGSPAICSRSTPKPSLSASALHSMLVEIYEMVQDLYCLALSPQSLCRGQCRAQWVCP